MRSSGQITLRGEKNPSRSLGNQGTAKEAVIREIEPKNKAWAYGASVLPCQTGHG